MSSLFSIGEDELDLDDEDFLLEACEIEVSRINNDALSQEAQQVPHGENKTCSYEHAGDLNRKPFTSLGNVETRNRAVRKTTANIVNRGNTNSTKCSGSNIGAFTSTSTNQTSGISSLCGSKIAGTSSLPPSKRFALEGSGTETSKSRSSCLVTSSSKNSSSTVGASSFSRTERSHGSFGGNQVSCTRDNSVTSWKSLNAQGFANGHKNPKTTVNMEDNSAAVWPGKLHQPHREKKSPNGYFYNKPISQSSVDKSSNKVSCSSKSAERVSRFKNHSRTDNNSQRNPVHSARNLQQRSGSSVASSSTSVHSNNRAGQQSFSKAGTPHRMGSDFHSQSPIPSVSFEKRDSLKASPHTSRGTPIRESSGPCTTPLSARTPRTRKFPGPAGLLPKLVQGQNLDNVMPVSSCPMPRSPAVQNKISPPNPSDDEEFKRDPWASMYQDFLQNIPVVMRYSITRVYTEVTQQRLDRGKVPCMCALVKAVSLTEADASVLLKDPTGEIHGTVHHKVLEEYQSELGPGAGLVLKQVSVFSPSPRKHYLNITPGNILQIYPPDPHYISSSQSTASQASQRRSTVTEKRTESPDKTVTRESRIVVDDERIGESEDTRASQDAATSLEEDYERAMFDAENSPECIEDLLQGLEDDDIFDEALLV